MKELFRLLLLLVVILPLALLLSGPLLTLAALRGRQRIGPIVLNPGRPGIAGRIGALLLGLFVWLVVWGGLAVILSGAVLPAMSRSSSAVLRASVTPTRPPVIPTFTPTPLPSPTPQIPLTPTWTRPRQNEAPPPSASPTPVPSPTPSPLPLTPTPMSPAATPIPPTPTPPPTATITPQLTATFAPSPAPLATLSSQQVTEAITVVEAANELLRTAVIEPSIGNLAALETLWRGEALARAQVFAQDLSQRYVHPLEVTFVYLAPPVVQGGNSPDTALVISTEAWTYIGARSVYGESFDFTYTLRREGDNWVITDYNYGYASIILPPEETGRPTPMTIPATITATVVITPAGQ